jgi:uncharacterized repeat protein (TIGR02543 family)
MMSAKDIQDSPWKGAVGFFVVLAAALLLPGVAQAGNVTQRDGHDSRSALDIASVGHSFNGGLAVVHTLRTFKPFSGRLLKNGNAVAFAFDSNGDYKPDRLAIVLWVDGKLRGAVMTPQGKVLALAAVARPNSRTIAVGVPVDLVANRAQANYRWLTMTLYKNKKGCPKTCTDVAPNRGLIVNQLWRLETLSVSIAGSGRVRGPNVECAIATCSVRYRRGTRINLNAVPEDGWVFTGWSGACTGTAECIVTMDSAKSVTANFQPMYVLSVSVAGPGLVTVSPPNANCSSAFPCMQRYVVGTNVTLTAATGTQFIFDGWSGACTGTTPVCTITMDGNKSVIANTRIRPSTLSVGLDVAPGAGGHVTSVPAGIDCPGDCSEPYSTETNVTLTATADPGSVFTGWNSMWCPNTPTCVLNVWPTQEGNKSVAPSFVVATR